MRAGEFPQPGAQHAIGRNSARDHQRGRTLHHFQRMAKAVDDDVTYRLLETGGKVRRLLA